MSFVAAVAHKEPDKLVRSLFEFCDALMEALDAASENGDRQHYDEIVDLLIRAASLIDRATMK
jgi:hypothetical protein